MTLTSAEAAIRAILAALPDSELPKGRTEKEGDSTLVWFGGHGYHLGSAKKRKAGGEWTRNPETYRDDAVREAIEHEAVYRLDLKHLEESE